MSFAPYISFDGNCEAALRFYAQVFKSPEPTLMRWSEAPNMDPGGNQPDPNHIMHGEVMNGVHALRGSDNPPGWYQAPQGVAVSHNVDSVEEGQRVFDALAEGGRVNMPYGPSFFSKGFGMLTDQFGINWMVVVDGFPT